MTPVTLDDLEAQLDAALKADDAQAIARIGRELDQLEAETKRRQTSPSCLAAALWYAEQGLAVFALAPGSKIPRKGSAGCKDATSDPATIRKWWANDPEANVAIATGHLVDVIDIDGLPGQISIADDPEVLDGLVVIGSVSTPRPGGLHYYIAATGSGNRAGILPSVDHRGRGGYVVAPPSVNADGERYVWLEPLDASAIGKEAAA
jgi:hypothetical protein